MRGKAFWVQHTHLFRADEYECSVCGAVYSKQYKQCPNCGVIITKSKHDASWVAEAEVLDILDDGF